MPTPEETFVFVPFDIHAGAQLCPGAFGDWRVDALVCVGVLLPLWAGGVGGIGVLLLLSILWLLWLLLGLFGSCAGAR